MNTIECTPSEIEKGLGANWAVQCLDSERVYDRETIRNIQRFIEECKDDKEWEQEVLKAEQRMIARCKAQNVYDATLSAAAYLCRGAGGESLSTPSGLARAAYSYNHSRAYVSKVLDYAYRYSDGEIGAGSPQLDSLPAFPTTTIPPSTLPPTSSTVPEADQP